MKIISLKFEGERTPEQVSNCDKWFAKMRDPEITKAYGSLFLSKNCYCAYGCGMAACNVPVREDCFGFDTGEKLYVQVAKDLFGINEVADDYSWIGVCIINGDNKSTCIVNLNDKLDLPLPLIADILEAYFKGEEKEFEFNAEEVCPAE